MRCPLIEIVAYLLLGQAFAFLIAAVSCPLPFVLALMGAGGLINITGLLLLKWQIRLFDRNSRDQPLK